MTRFLRTASTRRLIATIAGVLVVIGAGTAIAVAAGGSGPVPPKTSLARAVHTALTGPKVQGISARISFTNHLINASELQGASDPILSGATGRLWISNDNRMRLELQSDNGDAQVVVNKGSFWIYDPASKTAYEGALPASKSAGEKKGKPATHEGPPSIAQIQRGINRLAHHLDLSGAIPGDVAGRPVYTVKVAPKHDGGLLGNVQLAWDAARGIPLRVGIYARNQSSPVLQLKVTNISYGPVSTSNFAIKPPSGSKIVKIATPSGHKHSTMKAGKRHKEVSGAAAVASKVPFTLAAPRSLDGLKRRSVSLLDWGGTPAALVTYGQNLGGVAVIEQVAKQSGPRSQQGGGGNENGPSLPTVSIGGATAQELATPLGTVIEFSRNGVSYTVIGSVPAAAAELAARAL